MEKEIILEVNFKSECDVLLELFWYTLVWMLVSLGALFYLSVEIFCIFLGFYFVIYFLPVIILHYNYEQYNKGKKLMITEKGIDFDGNFIPKETIKHVIFYGNILDVEGKNSQSLPFQSHYFYLEIESENNEKIYLTSLYSKKIMDILQGKLGIKIKKENIYYPRI